MLVGAPVATAIAASLGTVGAAATGNIIAEPGNKTAVSNTVLPPMNGHEWQECGCLVRGGSALVLTVLPGASARMTPVAMRRGDFLYLQTWPPPETAAAVQ
jgi:hypothetical protein